MFHMPLSSCYRVSMRVSEWLHHDVNSIQCFYTMWCYRVMRGWVKRWNGMTWEFVGWETSVSVTDTPPVRWISVDCKRAQDERYLSADGVRCPQRHRQRLAVAADEVTVVEDEVFGSEEYSRSAVRQVPAVWEEESTEETQVCLLKDSLIKFLYAVRINWLHLPNILYKGQVIFSSIMNTLTINSLPQSLV